VIVVFLQLLLSSSMDKTVRLWDTESKVCLKTFTHSDYGERSEHLLSPLKLTATCYIYLANLQ
jgi:WD40 repeat protein